MSDTTEAKQIKKRELSDAQKNNLKKGMEALKAKRESLRKEQETESTTEIEPQQKVVEKKPAPVVAPVVAPQEPVITPVVAPVKERKPRVAKKNVSFDDFNNFKNELLTSLKPSTAQPVSIEKIIEKPVERIIDKQTIKYLSGSDLLDRVFFNK